MASPFSRPPESSSTPTNTSVAMVTVARSAHPLRLCTPLKAANQRPIAATKIKNEIWLRPGSTLHVQASENSPVTCVPADPETDSDSDIDSGQRLIIHSDAFIGSTRGRWVLRAATPRDSAFAKGWESLPVEVRLHILGYVLVADHPLSLEECHTRFYRFLYPLLVHAARILDMEVLARSVFYGANTFCLENMLYQSSPGLVGCPSSLIRPWLRRVELVVEPSTRQWLRSVLPLAELEDWPNAYLHLRVTLLFGSIEGICFQSKNHTVKENKKRARKAFVQFLKTIFRARKAISFHCKGKLTIDGPPCFRAQTELSIPDQFALDFQEGVESKLRDRVLFQE